MNHSAEVWAAFARTFSMLLVVLIVLVILFYLIKRFSNRGRCSSGLITVLEVHYISPKEKIILLDVLKAKILVGVTSQGITKLAALEGEIDTLENDQGEKIRFADFLPGKLVKSMGKGVVGEKGEKKE